MPDNTEQPERMTAERRAYFTREYGGPNLLPLDSELYAELTAVERERDDLAAQLKAAEAALAHFDHSAVWFRQRTTHEQRQLQQIARDALAAIRGEQP